MKNLFQALSIFFLTIGCKAQSPVINIEDDDGNSLQNAYYKDTNNLLNPFEGTYLYTNGTTSLTIILQKKTMVYDGYKYEDLLIGEYQYIENGVEKINTLNNLNTITTNQWEHNINGNSILSQGLPGCQDCISNEKRLRLSLFDLVADCSADIIIRKAYRWRESRGYKN